MGALAVLWILKLRGTKICVVFHDIRYDRAKGWKQRVRVAFQYRTMRLALRWAARVVLTVPASQVPWLPKNSAAKATFIPVGANLPEAEWPATSRNIWPNGVATIAVFGITEGEQGQREAAEISFLIGKVIEKLPNVRVVAMGRGSTEAEDALRRVLEGSEVQISVCGLLAAEKVRENLVQADVLLCVRGHISSRRGSAIAGIACGLPVVGYRGEETAFPITEAGVLLVESGDRDGMAEALCRVLGDDKLREGLRQRSVAAQRKFFSWDAIAAQFLHVLTDR
ncbi:MAG TPA: glycosyltransferase [Candidatus Acidoferrales bacterium]|nr:glycosyltransferase [Candidatus Acidoferrales bacterium]